MRNQEASRVLIIDDERSVRENIAAYLEDSDFEVFEAENGRIGLERFRTVSPDVVLVDIDMPELNGFEVLKQVRSASDEIPVVIISGAGEVANAIEASRLGAWDFVLKPIHNMAVVEHIILRVLEHRSLLQENREYKEDLERKVRDRTISLEMKSNELQSANKQLKAEIEERKLAEARLRQAKERSIALRRFSNRIAEFKDEALLLKTALEELCANIYLSGAVLFHSFKNDRLTQFLPGIPPCDFLHKLPVFDFIQSIYSNRSQEIVVFNNVVKDSKIVSFYADRVDEIEDLVGSHFAFVRGKSLHHHLFCFYRDPLYAPFINLDIEYMKSMVNEINTAYTNIQIITANNWLEKRLKSAIPKEGRTILVQKHQIPGFDLATSVFPSYEIKAEWHKPIAIDRQMCSIIMSDVPGMGMSDVMYNEMSANLIGNNSKILRMPQEVIAILNAELQTDFHPNRYLTLNYFLANGKDGSISYNSLGHDVMGLVRIGPDCREILKPQISPFIQVYIKQSADYFRQERAILKNGEILLGFSSRLTEIVDPVGNRLELAVILGLIQENSCQDGAEIMEKVVSYLTATFPKELQQDDVNLVLFKRT